MSFVAVETLLKELKKYNITISLYFVFKQIFLAAEEAKAAQTEEKQPAAKKTATKKSAEKKAATLTDLHECAKDTFDIWQNGGLFARQKALRILRAKAGFRLEHKRIGNYVAKTFDLMNEARSAYARAQQLLFAADMSYKIRPGIYADIRERLDLLLPEDNPLAQ